MDKNHRSQSAFFGGFIYHNHHFRKISVLVPFFSAQSKVRAFYCRQLPVKMLVGKTQLAKHEVQQNTPDARNIRSFSESRVLDSFFRDLVKIY